MSIYPARNIFQIRSSVPLSILALIGVEYCELPFKISIRILWCIESNAFSTSTLINHFTPDQACLIVLSAVWQLFFGLKPWEFSKKIPSHLLSIAALSIPCTTLSLADATLIGLFPPLGLGINILFAGFGL
uniref:Uncharacterized protein n=1 Tax=Rhizaria sp. TaxID=2204297 RepID=A0A5P8DJV4_9EUKA|nr:hypothetical protein [Rhizaria sp.]